MKVFIVALPLFDSTMSVAAYRLCSRSGNKTIGIQNDFRGMSEVFLSPGLDLIERVGCEAFAMGHPLLVEINQFQFQTGVPLNRKINPGDIVCELSGSMTPSPETIAQLAKLNEAGYTIALNGFPLNGIQSPLFDYASCLILDYKNPRFEICQKAVRAQLPHIKVVASNIPDMEAFEKLSHDDGMLFSGDFYNQPITQGLTEIAPIKINSLQLLNEVNSPDFELEEIAHIIERDPALSISLLGFINSSAVGLSRKVGSITSAVAILGQNAVRRWATVAISVSLGEDRPTEITRLSLIRAKFAENLAFAFELGVFQNALFITGLFSLLDVILQKPMDEAITEVAVDDEVKKALVEKSGKLYSVLELIYAYEHADWDKCSILIIHAGTDVEAVTKAFVDALFWYDQLLNSIDENEQQEEAKKK